MRFTNATTLRITFSVPCRGTAPNLTLDLNAKGHAHLFWDAREVTAEGSEIPLRGSRAFSVSVPRFRVASIPEARRPMRGPFFRVGCQSTWQQGYGGGLFTDSQRRCVLHASVRLEDEVSGICLIVQGYLVKSVASHAGDVRTA